jgi:putative membrane protein
MWRNSLKITRGRIIQIISVFIVHAITLFLLQRSLSGFQVDSLRSLVAITIALAIAQSAFWWVFINFFAWLPSWLYPILTFILNGFLVMVIGNLVRGVAIDSVATGIWIAIWLAIVDAILGELLSLDEDARFDRNVTRRMVSRRGKPAVTDVPGFLFLEIDGLSETLLRQAMEKGDTPTMNRWVDQGSHQLLGWETDFSSQTGAMQTGILLGNNTDVPAYRWWDRTQNRIVMSGMPKDAKAIEERLSSGIGLCSDGGASRGNMFSGDATESMLTFSTVRNKDRGRGPGFYFYLFSPYVIARLLTRFITEVIKEWWQASQQRRRKDIYRVKARGLAYGFLRGFMGPVLQDLVTYTVISDILRGLPAVYALYAGYDDLSHFAGMTSPEAFEALHEVDRYFARLESAIKDAPRPYHIIILADHGQSLGPTFEAAHGKTLEHLVKELIKSDQEVFYSDAHNDSWDNLNAVLSESTNANTRTAGLIRKMFASRTKDDYVEVTPKGTTADNVADEAEKAQVVVMGSGSTGLIYFTDSPQRMTFEQIQAAHPELVLGLKDHPGISFLLVRSEAQGDIVIGKSGVHYLKDDLVEGIDPLANFGPNAAMHLRRESSFSNCPDIVVNTLYDPATQELAGFENQVSHHGGLGGPQNHPFILCPVNLPYDGAPIIGAESVHHLLRGWREKAQNLKGLTQLKGE